MKKIIDLKEGKDYHVVKQPRKSYYDEWRGVVNKPKAKPQENPERLYVRHWVWIVLFIVFVWMIPTKQESEATFQKICEDALNGPVGQKFNATKCTIIRAK